MTQFKVGDRVRQIGDQFWRGIEGVYDGRSRDNYGYEYDYFIVADGQRYSNGSPCSSYAGIRAGMAVDSFEAVDETADHVNNPAHYASGDIECIDAIKAQMTADQFAGYLRGNIVKYLWRYEHKGGAESLEKAEWYLKRLIQEARNG